MTEPSQSGPESAFPDDKGDMRVGEHAGLGDPGNACGHAGCVNGEGEELPRVLARVMRALRAGAALGSAGAWDSGDVEPLVGAELGGGKYRLCGEIGRGGFGVVYVAEQCRPVCRQVAIKIAGGVAHDPRFADRLKDELHALASLDDPAIVRLLDSGVTPAGFPGGAGRQYLVMDLVRGEPLTEYCEREKLDFPERLLLLADAARAVAAAHRKGYIHRDLKPEHILVNEEGHVRLIDFGVAKLTEGERLSRTMAGQRIGSPRYMSPEQRAGRESEIDSRVDVYALGMVLADLVLGEEALALDPSTVARVPMSELLVRVRGLGGPESDGDSRLSGGTVRRWGRVCRAHVDWVIHKAVADSPEKRYESVEDLRHDLVRAAKGETVSASPSSSWRFFRSFVRRHPVLSTAAVALILAFAFFTPIVTALWLGNARLAGAAAQEAEAARFETYIACVGAAQVAVDAGSFVAAREHLENAPPEYRGWFWEHLSYRSRVQDRTMYSLAGSSAFKKVSLNSISIDPAGRHVAVAGADGQVTVLDTETGSIVTKHKLHEFEIYTVCFSPRPDGLLAAGGWADTLWLMGSSDEFELQPRGIPTEHPIIRLCFSPEGDLLAAGSADSPEVFLFSMPEAVHIATLRLTEGEAYALAFDSRGERLFVGTDTGRIETWDVGARERLAVANFGTSRIHAIECSPIEELLGVCFFDGSLLLLAPEPDGSLRVQARTQGTRGFLECAFSLDGSTLYTAGFETAVTAWSLPSLQQHKTWRQHEDHIYSLDVHPADGTVYSCSLDGTVQVLDPSRQQPVIEWWPMVYRSKHIKWDDLGRLVLVQTQDGTHLSHLETGRHTEFHVGSLEEMVLGKLSRQGDLSWTDTKNGDGWIVRADGQYSHFPNEIESSSTAIEEGIERRQGAVKIRVIVDGVALIEHTAKRLAYYDLATGQFQNIEISTLTTIDSVALRPSSKTPLVLRSGFDIFTADGEGLVRHMDRIPAGDDTDLRITRNDRWLFVCRMTTSEGWLYDLHTQKLTHHMPAKGRIATAVALTPDGRRAMFGRHEGDVDVMDTATGRLLASLPVSDNVQTVAFDDNGSLWARTYSGTTHVWRLAPKDPPHTDRVRDSRFE